MLEIQENVTVADTETRERAIREWLSPPDPSTNYQRGRKSRHALTGEWFSKGEAFKRWRLSTESSNVIWLHGKAGSGKTVLSTTIITELLPLREAPGKICLAYFFFDFNDSGKLKSSHMLRSVVSQLCWRSPVSLGEAESLMAGYSDGQDQPSDQDLLELLHRIVQQTDSTYIVVDALDESSDLEQSLEVLSSIHSWDLSCVHLLCASRWTVTISDMMKTLTKHGNIIGIQTHVVNEDIATYVSERLKTDPKLQRWHSRPDIQQEIHKALTSKADGM